MVEAEGIEHQDPQEDFPEIAVLGGGTGSFTILQEIKHLTPEISAIVNMSDSGGSTGRLRDEFGVLPPGDARQCLVALSEDPDFRDMFSFRMPEGNLPEEEAALAGHVTGNILITSETQRLGSLAKAIDSLSTKLGIVGKVVPVTYTNTTVCKEEDGEIIREEANISHADNIGRDARIFLDPPAEINPDADEAIRAADMVVIAPGNLYGSLMPVLAVQGVPEAFRETDAKKIVIANLVTKPGQTDGWHVVDYVKAIEKYVGEGQIDIVLFNSELPNRELLEKYAADGEFPVGIEEDRFEEIGAVAVGRSFVSDTIHQQDPNDKAIMRTLIRHDAARVREELERIYRGE